MFTRVSAHEDSNFSSGPGTGDYSICFLRKAFPSAGHVDYSWDAILSRLVTLSDPDNYPDVFRSLLQQFHCTLIRLGRREGGACEVTFF